MGAKVAAIARHRSFFFNHINDVMISHFAANNGHQMRVNALSRQRGWGSCWKTLIWIEVRDVSRVFFFSPPHTLIVKFKSGDDKQSDYVWNWSGEVWAAKA